MADVVQELRFAGRRLARAPLFTAITVLTLAVGIGANSAIFSVVNGVLLKPLPYERPEELVSIWHTAPGLQSAGRRLPMSQAVYFTYRAENRVFEDLGIADEGSVIGVRIALGARPGAVGRMVVGQAAAVTGAGVMIGLGAAVGLTRLMAGLLHGVRPVDPLTYGGVALVIATVALAASYLPARRAARIDPVAALRSE